MRHAILALFMLGVTAPAALADSVSFHSPSNNIHCYMSDESFNGVRCDIMEYTPHFSDPSCDLDFGFAFELQPTGPGYPVCAGDTVRNDSGFTLYYTESYSLGGITCRSERTGMTCMNAQGHGIFLSRARQAAY